MDKVQIYMTCFLTLELIGAGYLHGKPKEGEHNIIGSAIFLLMLLPLIGRIARWW